jgi:hypothetical protein
MLKKNKQHTDFFRTFSIYHIIKFITYFLATFIDFKQPYYPVIYLQYVSRITI